MSDECEIVETVEKKSPSVGPPLKKLKQSRLPFTPVNTKSPQQTDTPKSEKKRKLSGDNDSPNLAKTPRNENERADGKVADENRLTPAEKGATKDVVQKKGRPVGWTKKASSSKLNDSSQEERHAEEDDQSNACREKKKKDNKKKNTAQIEKSESDDRQNVCGETDCLDSSADEEEKDEGVDGDLETSRGNERQGADDPESSSEEEGDNDSTKEAEPSQKGEGKVARKRGRPRTKTLTPQDESKPKRSRGRPQGSKKIPRSVSKSDLNKSTCSNSKDDDTFGENLTSTPIATKKKMSPMVKTRTLLSLFAAEGAAKRAEKSRGGSPSPVQKVDGGRRVDEKRDGGDEKSRADKAGEGQKDETKSKKLKSEKLVKNKEEEEEEEKDEIEEVSVNAKEESKKGKERILFPLDKETDKSDKAPSEDGDTCKSDENEENVDKMLDGKDEDRHDRKSTNDQEDETTKTKDKFDKAGRDKEGKDEQQHVKNQKDREREKNDNSDESEARTACETGANLDGSLGKIDASACDSEPNASLASSPTTSRDVSSDTNNSPSSAKEQTPSSSSTKSRLFVKHRSLTPKQKEREAAKLLREKEKEKKKQEKDKQTQEKMAEKERMQRQKEEEKKQKEEEKKQKEEEKRQKEEERQKQKEEKEKQREEQRKKKQEEFDAKKLKKEEEQQRKEEEKLKKEEEKQKMEEEKRKQSDVLKKKFASFFVAKKREMEESFRETEGPFQQFQVKEDMQLAPLVRLNLSEDQCAELDQYVSGVRDDVSKTYIEILKSQTYVPRKSQRTFPREKQEKDDDDDDDVEIIEENEEEEEEEEEDTSDVICDPAVVLSKNNTHKAKLLSFCENRRPAYWGTWSKKSSAISARRPLAKDVIFDYEYDSDDDWEEEEAGESLSDSEGEDKEEKEDEDQYEVDNDFFVPHGYLSDDEGKSDQEEEEEEKVDKDENKKDKDKDMEGKPERSKTTEQLKLKQAEFEEEMKKKTKELKPRVIGCLWLADENNNPAYKQLMKILSPHKGVTLCPQLPIASSYTKRNAPKEVDAEDGNGKKFVKTFPEEAVPALIKLLHGNRHGKAKLCREFCDYWRKLTGGELEESAINSTPKAAPPTSRSVHIAKRKVESKIQEIGVWKRQLDSSKNRYNMCWYVPQKTREEYGYEKLDLPNAWIYINKPHKKEEQDAAETDSPKVGKIRPITAFTKKILSTPTSATSSPISSANTTPQRELSPKTEELSEAASKTPLLSSRTAVGFTTPSVTPSTTPRTTQDAPNGGRSASSSSSSSKKKKVNLFPAKSPESGGGPKKGSIVSFFKKTRDSGTKPVRKDTAEDSAKKTAPPKEDDVIVLD